MTKRQFHVGIVGGGIGGLCLAQGLKKAGIRVSVFERDRARRDRLQGYRIHISPKGSRSLHKCLPHHLFKAFVETCGGEGNSFRFLTERMEELLTLDLRGEDHPVERHRSASRITLRQILLSGLDEVVHFHKMFERYDIASDGQIIMHFADGTNPLAMCSLERMAAVPASANSICLMPSASIRVWWALRARPC